jgi:hypothetical protein
MDEWLMKIALLVLTVGGFWLPDRRPPAKQSVDVNEARQGRRPRTPSGLNPVDQQRTCAFASNVHSDDSSESHALQD